MTDSQPLSIPTIDAESDVLTAALAYARCGWYILPIRNGSKHPGSVLGNDWHHQSSRDTDTIVSWLAGAAHGIALHVGRSGGVVLDIDDPEAVSATVRDTIVQSGAPFQSTRPDVPFRGHAVFAANGISYSNSTGDIGSGSDVRGANGIIVVAPSEHGSGGRYEWLQTGDVPEVPEAIASRLRVSQDASDAATDAEVSAFLTRYSAEASPGLLTPVLSRFEDETSHGGSRHQAAVSCAAQIAREAVAGKYGAADGFDALESLFVESVTKGDAARCTIPAARSEFAGVVAWAVPQAQSRDPGELAAQIDARTRPTLEPLGPDFWARRPELRHIQRAARSRGAAPDAVIHATLARVSSMQNPLATVDVGDGPTGLNLFACLVAPSGKGKSKAMNAAIDLLPAPPEISGDLYRDGVPPGSGEGIPEMFYGMIPEDPSDPKSRKERGIARQNVFIHVDEGETLKQLGQRKGTTLGPTMRSGYSGSTLGQVNASGDRTRIVPRGTYALGMAVGIQPGKLEAFFDDDEVGGGTPQRFTFANALSDPGALPRRDRPEWPGPLTGEGIGWPRQWYRPIPWLPAEAPGDDDYLEMRGDAPAAGDLDGHRNLTTIKVAALFAILSGRTDGVNEEDVELAQALVERSTAYRDHLFGERIAKQRDAAEAAIKNQVRAATSTRIKGNQADADLTRMTKWIAGKAEAGVRVRAGRGCLWQRLASRDRDEDVFEAALSRFLAESPDYEIATNDEGEEVLLATA